MTSTPVTMWLLSNAGEDLDALRQRARNVQHPPGWHTSRSYRFPVALVASWAGRVGADVEREDAYSPSDFAHSIATSAESLELPALLRRTRGPLGLWSSKEALAKALGQPLSYDPRRLDSPATWPKSASNPAIYAAGRWFAQTLPAPQGHHGWLVWEQVESLTTS